jgi:pimeloyl-ACP methyl ester carboxylesterase
MAFVTAPDGVQLYVEETGVGDPIVFVHEYAGDTRSWETQVRHLSRSYRCITFNARGYPPSQVPKDDTHYSQDLARDDVKAVMDGLKIDRAHIVGHSMGAYTTLHMGLHYPDRCRSLTVAGCGWGSNPDQRAQSFELARGIAELFRKEGIAVAAAKYADFPMRWQYKFKDPRGWAEFTKWMTEHSAEGHACTMTGVQIKRPTLHELKDALKTMPVPTLVIVGDEDEACIDGSVLMKRIIPNAGLLMLPRTGHTVNSEEPAAFNQALLEFFHAVEHGRWMAQRESGASPARGR